jgi:hypothetical protein
MAAFLLAISCVPAEGPSMNPFQDCLGCHGSSGSARAWTVAGTWRRGSQVTLVDQGGKTVGLVGNDVGNFYTAESLVFPLQVWVDGKQMADAQGPVALGYGGCNVCHHAETLTIGPLMAPGSDCLTCHGPAGMATAKFTAAGTWGSPAGTSVNVGGYATTTNTVGNFIFCAAAPCTYQGNVYGTIAPIPSNAWPVPASVGNQTMQGGAPYGGCNACHGRGGADSRN